MVCRVFGVKIRDDVFSALVCLVVDVELITNRLPLLFGRRATRLRDRTAAWSGRRAHLAASDASPCPAVWIALWVLFGLTIGGCGQVPIQLSHYPLDPTGSKMGRGAGEPGEPGSTDAMPAHGDTVPVTIGPPPDPSLDQLVYRIGPFDSLKIDVFGVEALSSSGVVNFQGLYTMPLAGAISLDGLTPAEAEVKIEQFLGGHYLRNPNVTVQVVSSANTAVILSGKMSGMRPISGRTTLGQVLASSGGVPATGKKRQVVIFRALGESRQTSNPKLHAYVVDYQAIMEGKMRDPLLVANDRIYVAPSALAIFFDPWLGIFKTYTPIDITSPAAW